MTGELAATADGKILALRTNVIADHGAFDAFESAVLNGGRHRVSGHHHHGEVDVTRDGRSGLERWHPLHRLAGGIDCIQPALESQLFQVA